MSVPWPNVESNQTTVVSVDVANVVITLLAANATRVAFKLSHEGAAGRIYVRLGAAASAALNSFYLDPGDYYESYVGEYNGIVTARGAVVGPNAMKVTELI